MREVKKVVLLEQKLNLDGNVEEGNEMEVEEFEIVENGIIRIVGVFVVIFVFVWKFQGCCYVGYFFSL